MKKHYALLCMLLPIFTFAQLTVHTVDVITNDLVYDSTTDRIYASIPSANGANGNSIGIINPHTYTLENTIFIGSEPTVLAISDNGQYLYAGFSGSSTVRRFDIATQTSGFQFGLGSDSSGSFYVEDIEVMPGEATTIAVSRRNVGYSPKHEGVAIYDNGVMRTNTTPSHTGSNRIEFSSSSTLIGYNNETTEYGIRNMVINNEGVSVSATNQSVLTGFYLDFSYYDHHMYATNGKIIDVTNTPFVIGTFSNVSGPGVYDTSASLVCYASYDFAGNITFQRFNPDTFLLADSLPITETSGDVASIITCGSGCYAFNSENGKVVIIQDTTMGLATTTSPTQLRVYPNPTTDYFQIESSTNVERVWVYDLTGRLVSEYAGQTERMFVGNLSAGNYVVKVMDDHQHVSTQKLIKK
ncbi:Por secretion system C-terminal sorting domain-containing protein [Pustulibacterium marinum]|uniref:Por secretion system C-terminal sorting domain-containing protein n=1 Tax=Pustulibacterium marinum TaxID=1224947 RepID=A0A1I7II41_9FLAO|nr:T9SS type A sorting domain-containing protein [Pustulibacterium marinum]SFU72569.1 Por secretion system C-terminal sorting domain-containing protein [Pustulibacterium marinum]